MNRGFFSGLVLACAAAACSSNGGGGSVGATDGGGGGGGGDDGGGAVATCEGSKMLALPDDPGARGPWAVGARTVMLAGLTTEVWYPATPGSDVGKAKTTYDLREHLPSADRSKIPDADSPLQACDCVRDLPFDDAHGPYPMVVFVHGTAGFRTQSLTFMAHWASRGFVVVAADHPGITLDAILGGGGRGADQAGDVRKMVTALASPSGDVAFLASHVDPKRIALAGHSAGGNAVGGLGDVPGARVIIAMAARGANAGASLKSTLVLGGQSDGIALYSRVQDGYDASPARKRLVGLANAGHLAFSDLCSIGKDKGGILQIATDHGIQVNPLIATLARDGCGAMQLAPEAGWAIVSYATSAVLEEELACSTGAAAKLAQLKTALPNVSEVREQLK